MKPHSPRHLRLTLAVLVPFALCPGALAEERAAPVVPQPVPEAVPLMQVQEPATQPVVVPRPVPVAEPVLVAEPAPSPLVTPRPAPAERAPQPKDVQKVFVIQHARSRDLARVLDVFPATIKVSTYADSGYLAVSAPPAVMPAIEETIKRLDVPQSPQKSVEITASVIEASVDPAEGAADLPAGLQGVVTQLRKTFNFAGYRLLDTLVARTGEGSNMKIKGTLAKRPGIPLTEFHGIECRDVSITGGASGRDVRLRRLKYSAQIAVDGGTAALSLGAPSTGEAHYDYRTYGFEAESLPIREGQQAVVGKFSIDAAGDALILVLSARVID